MLIKYFWILYSVLSVQYLFGRVSFNNYALIGVTIINANYQTPLLHQTVLNTHNTISGIFNDGSKPIPDSFNLLQMDGKYLLPGLIDADVHMATDPSGTDNREHTLDVLRRMLYSGVGFVR